MNNLRVFSSFSYTEDGCSRKIVAEDGLVKNAINKNGTRSDMLVKKYDK